MSFLLKNECDLHEIIAKMSLREKIGQMNQLIVSHEDIEDKIKKAEVGSVIIINDEDIERSIKQKKLAIKI